VDGSASNRLQDCAFGFETSRTALQQFGRKCCKNVTVQFRVNV
jgi:hypothetical protein